MIKIEKKLQKTYLPDYNLMIAQNLWQAHYKILSIIFLKKFIKLNIDTETMIKKQKTCRIKCKYCDCFLECIKFKDDSIEHKCLLLTLTLTHGNNKFVYFFFAKRYTLDDWKKLNEASLSEKKDFYSPLNMRNNTMQIPRMQKEFVKTLK